MEKELQNIFDKARQIKLSTEENDKMRAGLELFMEKHPVRNTDMARHILQERSIINFSLMEILTLKPLINKLKLQPMTIILIIALVLGGGTSFAAESALPGDALYAIKVGVNEEIRGFVAFSDSSQARWEARRSERRLEEAEELAVKGRLNAETRSQIESSFKGHAEAFGKSAEKLESKQDTQNSLEVSSNFEASLKAHEQALISIAKEKTSARGEVNSLLIEVRTRLNATEKTRSNAEVKVSAEINGEFKNAAEGKLRAAENKISEVSGFIERMRSSVSADANAQAEARIKVASEIVIRGKAEMTAETYGKAFASFQEAIRVAQEAKLLVETGYKINLELKSSGINLETENRSELENNNQNNSTEVKEEVKVKIDVGL